VDLVGFPKIPMKFLSKTNFSKVCTAAIMCELEIHSAIYNKQDDQTQLQFSREKASVKILALATKRRNEL
jgi:hypothetical protein